MDKLKAIKVKQASGQYGEAIPIGVDATNVDLINGKDLETSVTFLDEDSQETDVDFTAVELQRGDIVDNLSSADGTTKVLSANQGRVLNNKVNDMTVRFDNVISAVTLDSEVQDIRVKADGTTATSAGNAVREQVSELKEDLVNKNITEYKPQLFDYSSRHDGGYYRYHDDKFYENEEYFYTDLIEVNGTNLSVSMGHVINILFYDDAKKFISGTITNRAEGVVGYNISIPSNAMYFRISGQITNEILLMVNYGSVPLSYTPYGTVINWSYGEHKSVLTSSSLNIFNKNDIVGNYYINQDTFDVTGNADYFYSHIINIEPNIFISTSSVCFITFFDKDLQPISGVAMNYTRNDYKIFESTKTPNNACYMIVSGTKTILNNLCITYGGSISDYVEYQKTIKALKPNRFKGINVLFMGDSLTHGVEGGASIDYGWVQFNYTYPAIAEKTIGFNVSQAGYPGASALSYYNRVHDNNGGSTNGYPFDVRNFDTICIMLGTNQGLTDTLETDVYPYDNFENYADTNTGGYCKLIEYIYSLNTHAQIIIITPPYGNNNSDRETQQNTTYEVLKKISNHYNIAIIDVFKESGISKANYQTYMPIDGLHLTKDGYKKLGTFIGNKLANILSYIN